MDSEAKDRDPRSKLSLERIPLDGQWQDERQRPRRFRHTVLRYPGSPPRKSVVEKNEGKADG